MGVTKSGFDSNVNPETTNWAEHSAVGDVSTGRRFKAVQQVPMKVLQDLGDTYRYYGFAKFGTNAGDALWRVFRETVADGTLEAADGDDLFDNVWNDRDSLSYS